MIPTPPPTSSDLQGDIGYVLIAWPDEFAYMGLNDADVIAWLNEQLKSGLQYCGYVPLATGAIGRGIFLKRGSQSVG